MCLRCNGVELVPSGPSVHAIEFFDCPDCHRRQTRKLGGSLTFRWSHPISLVLYEILFDSKNKSSAVISTSPLWKLQVLQVIPTPGLFQVESASFNLDQRQSHFAIFTVGIILYSIPPTGLLEWRDASTLLCREVSFRWACLKVRN